MSAEEYRKLPARAKSRKAGNADKSGLFLAALKRAGMKVEYWPSPSGTTWEEWWVAKADWCPWSLAACCRAIVLRPQYHFRVGDERNPCRFDFAYLGELRSQIAIEIDGHAGAGRGYGSESEYRKRAEAQAAGWKVLSFTTTQCRKDPLWVAEMFRRTLEG